MFELRDYQKKAVEEGLKFMNNSDKKGAIIVAPTGSGKSLIIASIAEGLEGKTLVLQPSLEILQSNLEKAKILGIDNITVYSASAGVKEIGDLTFATIGSITNKKELFKEFSNLIVDECHLVSAKGGMYKDLIKFMGGKVLGLTATPYRIHCYRDFKTGEKSVVAKFLHRTRPKMFSKIIHITQVEELYKKKFLCPIKYYGNESYDYSKIKLNSTGLNFDEKSLALYNSVTKILEVIFNVIAGEKAKHILVFLSSVEESSNMVDYLKFNSITAEIISAKTPKKERAEILKRFKTGEVRVVCNVSTMTTGYDFPALDCVILGRPTQSIALYYQMLGRGLRIFPGKEFVKVYDICGNVKRFGRIETFMILEEKKGMHRLRSNKGFLTGYDFYHNKDVEASGYKGLKESTFMGGGQLVPFGKHKGKHITKIPNDYLDWCVKTFTKGTWKKLFADEKARRNKSDAIREPIDNQLPF